MIGIGDSFGCALAKISRHKATFFTVVIVSSIIFGVTLALSLLGLYTLNSFKGAIDGKVASKYIVRITPSTSPADDDDSLHEIYTAKQRALESNLHKLEGVTVYNGQLLTSNGINMSYKDGKNKVSVNRVKILPRSLLKDYIVNDNNSVSNSSSDSSVPVILSYSDAEAVLGYGKLKYNDSYDKKIKRIQRVYSDITSTKIETNILGSDGTKISFRPVGIFPNNYPFSGGPTIADDLVDRYFRTDLGSGAMYIEEESFSRLPSSIKNAITSSLTAGDGFESITGEITYAEFKDRQALDRFYRDSSCPNYVYGGICTIGDSQYDVSTITDVLSLQTAQYYLVDKTLSRIVPILVVAYMLIMIISLIYIIKGGSLGVSARSLSRAKRLDIMLIYVMYGIISAVCVCLLSVCIGVLVLAALKCLFEGRITSLVALLTASPLGVSGAKVSIWNPAVVSVGAIIIVVGAISGVIAACVTRKSWAKSSKTSAIK